MVKFKSERHGKAKDTGNQRKKEKTDRQTDRQTTDRKSEQANSPSFGSLGSVVLFQMPHWSTQRGRQKRMREREREREREKKRE